MNSARDTDHRKPITWAHDCNRSIWKASDGRCVTDHDLEAMNDRFAAEMLFQVLNEASTG